MLKTINDGITPTLATEFSAGVDLYANADVTIRAGETAFIPLGVCIDQNSFDRDFAIKHVLELHPKSSLRAKGLIIGVKLIDMDFKNEFRLIVHNPTKPLISNDSRNVKSAYVDHLANYHIKKGDKVAQVVLKEHKTALMGFTSTTKRNEVNCES